MCKSIIGEIDMNKTPIYVRDMCESGYKKLPFIRVKGVSLTGVRLPCTTAQCARVSHVRVLYVRGR